MMDAQPLLLLLGGSFNPPHSGHMRVALETAEFLNPEKVLFIPNAVPPHKSEKNLLSFEFRCAMLRAAIADMGSFFDYSVNEVENERQGPSYTFETLKTLAERNPEKRLAFVMGSEDYTRLDSWRMWKELPEYADLIVVPRNTDDPDIFRRTSQSLWSEAREMPILNYRTSNADGRGNKAPGAAPAGVKPCPAEAETGNCSREEYIERETAQALILPHGGRLLYLPQPRLEISSSLVRERLIAGRSLDFLVPPGILKLLYDNLESVKETWKTTNAAVACCAKS